MFRCYFTRVKQMSMAIDLNVATLGAAIAAASKILAEDLEARDFSGIEIWQGQALMCKTAV